MLKFGLVDVMTDSRIEEKPCVDGKTFDKGYVLSRRPLPVTGLSL